MIKKAVTDPFRTCYRFFFPAMKMKSGTSQCIIKKMGICMIRINPIRIQNILLLAISFPPLTEKQRSLPYSIMRREAVANNPVFFRSLRPDHSSSTSGASPSPPGWAVWGWSLCRHPGSRSPRCRGVSQGIRSPERIPALHSSCLRRSS